MIEQVLGRAGQEAIQLYAAATLAMDAGSCRLPGVEQRLARARSNKT